MSRCPVFPRVYGRLSARDLERATLSCGLVSLAAFVKRVERRLRRGENIPFREIKAAVDGSLRTELIQEMWDRLGLNRSLRMPVEVRWLRPEIKNMLPTLPWQKRVNLLMEKIAKLASQPTGTARDAIATPVEPSEILRKPGPQRKAETETWKTFDHLKQKAREQSNLSKVTNENFLNELRVDGAKLDVKLTTFNKFLNEQLNRTSKTHKALTAAFRELQTREGFGYFVDRLKLRKGAKGHP